MPQRSKRRTAAYAAAASLLTASASIAVAVFPAQAAGTPLAHAFPTHVTYKVGVMPSASQASRDAAVQKAYDSWKATYLTHGCATNEYYVNTKGDHDATNDGPVSEGQGYGMNIVPLMAGYDADAKTEFDGLWQLVKDHKDQWGMMQWQLDGKSCKYYSGGAPDSATDGDLDIGYGLLLADAQWGGYTADAKQWLADLYAHDVAPDGHLRLADDDASNADTRPSDHMIDHLRAFAAYDTAHDWNKVVTRTEAVDKAFSAGHSSSSGLLSDFVLGADTSSPKPAPANYLENQPDNIVGYNSIRVPWHMGTDALVNGSTTASVAYGLAVKESNCLKTLSGGKPANVYSHINLNCTKYNTDQSEESGDSVGPSAMAAGDQAWTDAIWNQLATNPFGDGYYGESIKVLVYIVMAGDYWTPGGTSSGGGSTSYEAESGANTLGGDAALYSCSACSGGSRVGHLGKNSGGTGTLTFNGVTAAGGAGTYQVAVAFTNGSTSRTAQISVNGGAPVAVAFGTTGAFTTPGTQTVALTLASGTNTISFTNASASAPDLDKITVPSTHS